MQKLMKVEEIVEQILRKDELFEIYTTNYKNTEKNLVDKMKANLKSLSFSTTLPFLS